MQDFPDSNEGASEYQKPRSTLVSVLAFVVPPLLLLSTCTTEGGPSDSSPGFFVGYVGAQIALIGGSVYYFWLRNSRLWVKITVLTAIALFCLFAGLMKVGANAEKLKKDVGSLSTVEMDKEGNVKLPSNIDQGPLSALIVKQADHQKASSASYMKELSALGREQMVDANTLASNRSLLKDCARFQRFKSRIEHYRQETASWRTNIKKEIAALDYPAETLRGFIKGFEAAEVEARRNDNETWDTQIALMDVETSACQLLAKGQWVPNNGVFEFNDQATLNQFNALVGKSDAINAKIEELQSERLERFNKSQEELKGQL